MNSISAGPLAVRLGVDRAREVHTLITECSTGDVAPSGFVFAYDDALALFDNGQDSRFEGCCGVYGVLDADSLEIDHSFSSESDHHFG